MLFTRLFPFFWQKISECSYAFLFLLFASDTVVSFYAFLESLSSVLVIVFLKLFQAVLIYQLFKLLVQRIPFYISLLKNFAHFLFCFFQASAREDFTWFQNELLI